jgi:phage terminase large subunit-like protein
MSRELDIAQAQAHLRAIENQKTRLKEGLPFLHKDKEYKWEQTYMASVAKEQFVNAANQLGKSSRHIKKLTTWATHRSLWPKLWPGLAPGEVPNQFWYLYPNKDTTDVEFDLKWKLYLPKNEFKNHTEAEYENLSIPEERKLSLPVYGWEEKRANKHVHSCEFKSGVTTFFKTYNQAVEDLQTGTCYAIFFDEELPVELLAELQMRLNATDGYLCGVFTPTLAQEYWRRTMQPDDKKEELHRDAFKLQVSLYDCQTYADGTPSKWSTERIKKIEAKCPTDADIQIRVHGKFAISSENKMVPAFNRVRNMVPGHVLPRFWSRYVGVDPGGGGDGHPASIIFLAVSPDTLQARVYKAWRGDEQITTSGDVYDKYEELRNDYQIERKVYDFAAKDFGTIANGKGAGFEMANKSRDAGFGTLNTLLKLGVLKLYEDDDEINKLATEMETLKKSTRKIDALDDLVDALRYAVMAVPWDWVLIDEMISIDEPKPEEPEKVLTSVEQEIEERRARGAGTTKRGETEIQSIEDELDEWSALY